MKMVIGIMGESCVGKSTLAEKLSSKIGAEIYTGKDYLRLAKSEERAKEQFVAMLQSAMTEGHAIYVISELDQLPLLPEGAKRVLMTAELELIISRFTARMNGKLPEPVRSMLKRRHGIFDGEEHELHIDGAGDIDSACESLCALLG